MSGPGVCGAEGGRVRVPRVDLGPLDGGGRDARAWFAVARTPDDGSAEAWARAYVAHPDPAGKLAPPPRPRLVPSAAGGLAQAAAPPTAPGRGPGFRVAERADRVPRPGALARPLERAKLLHTFLHHEVQAAELMAWALLAFPGAPARWRRGVLGVLDDEVRHARAYASRLADLGHAYGDFPVRDWFWQRVPAARDPRAFVALMGMGFEGGNLEHTRRFARELAAAGDGGSAALVAAVGAEEVAHVRFGTRWFQRFAGAPAGAAPAFEAWRAALPPPLTPTVLRGKPLDRDRRRAAGQDDAFLDALDAW